MMMGMRSGLILPARPAGLELWFDASNALSITQSAGAISQWNDLSGNANNATQSSGSLQPSVSVGAAPSGINGVGFSSSYMNLANPINNTTESQTMFAVVKRTPFNGAPLLGNASNTASFFDFLYTGSGEILISTGSYYFSNFTVPLDTNWHLFIFQYNANGSLANLWVDGVSYPVTTTAWSGSSTFNTLGYAWNTPATMVLGEVQLYNNVVSSTGIASITANLKSKWGV